MRRLRHFFCSTPSFAPNQEVFLERDETHHLKDVLRFEEGDLCLLSNGKGSLAEAVVKSFSGRGEALLSVKTVLPSDKSQNIPEIKVFFALPQKGKGDSILEKAQEIGITAAYPLKTQRTVLKMNAASAERVLIRWKKIIKGAAKQSRALNLLETEVPRRLEEALTTVAESEEIIILHPSEKAESFQRWILDKRARAPEKPVSIFIGPEGGFTEDEVDLITAKGAKCLSLNSNILRVETAVVGIMACLKFLLGKEDL